MGRLATLEEPDVSLLSDLDFNALLPGTLTAPYEIAQVQTYGLDWAQAGSFQFSLQDPGGSQNGTRAIHK
jgi:hypothetical protein